MALELNIWILTKMNSVLAQLILLSWQIMLPWLWQATLKDGIMLYEQQCFLEFLLSCSMGYIREFWWILIASFKSMSLSSYWQRKDAQGFLAITSKGRRKYPMWRPVSKHTSDSLFRARLFPQSGNYWINSRGGAIFLYQDDASGPVFDMPS